VRPLACLLAVVLSGCGGTSPFRGFPESQVAVAESRAEPVDGCAALTGRLVIEVQDVLVREYPHYGAIPKGHGVRPLLVVTLEAPDFGPPHREAAVLIGPQGFQPGESVDFFAGRRIVDRPARHLLHRSLELRLFKNDSTAPPEWLEYLRKLTLAAPAGTLVGVNVPGAAIADAAWLFAQLDPDDLILVWKVDLDPVLSALGPVRERRALRLRGITPRPVGGGAAPAPATAELRLLAFEEPEPGCG
jgi:hypothetical protein